MIRRIVAVMAAAVLSIAAMGPPVEIKTVVDRNRIHMGDPVQLAISAIADENIRIIMPGDDVKIAPFTVLDKVREVGRGESGKTTEKLILTVSAYEIGELEIPALPVLYETPDGRTDTLMSDAVTVTVESILKEGDTSPRDIKPPLEVEAGWRYKLVVTAAILGILLLVALFIWLILRQRKVNESRPEPPPAPRPAHETALEALEDLSRKGFIGQGKLKLFFIEMTEIFKVYLHQRYAIPIIERTTGEIRRDIRQVQMAPKDRQEIIDILELADLVKFARFVPPEHLCFESLGRTIEFVRRTAETLIAAQTPVTATPGQGGEKQ